MKRRAPMVRIARAYTNKALAKQQVLDVQPLTPNVSINRVQYRSSDVYGFSCSSMP